MIIRVILSVLIIALILYGLIASAKFIFKQKPSAFVYVVYSIGLLITSAGILSIIVMLF